MRCLTLFLAWLAVPLPASSDWLAQPLPRPLAQAWEISLGLRQAQRETWAHRGGHALLVEADGQKVERRLEGRLDLRWQAGPRGSLVLTVPLVFAELATWGGAVAWPRVDDPGVARSQGLGDLGLEWRHDRGGPQGWAWGFGLGLQGPSGLGPWEAPHPLAATGEGRWQGRLRLSAGHQGRSVGFFGTLAGRAQDGREAVLAPAAPLLYDAGGVRLVPAELAGPAYLAPRLGAEGVLGMAWDWHRDEDSRHSLGLSLAARHLGPWGVGGRAVEETAPTLVWLQPELQARFGGFGVLLGWQSPALYDDNLAVPYWGELILRLDHAF